MGRTVGILGPSGTGKSTSIRNLDPKETYLINIASKEVPIPGSESDFIKKEDAKGDFHNRRDTHDPGEIEFILKKINSEKGQFKNIIIDDIQYLMSFEFMSRIKEKGWDKFQDIALHFFDVIQQARSMRSGLNIFFMGHVSEKDDGMKGLKTVGKATDQYTNPEGLFTMILQTEVFPEKEKISDRYRFMTQTDGERVCRSPMGMFEKTYIPNDLQFIVDRMDEYYS